MRAVYLEGAGEHVTHLTDSSVLHHLQKVLRVKTGQEILLLNGKGDSFLFKILSIGKREIEIEFLEKKEDLIDTPNIDLLQFVTKRDSLELIIRQATEVGVKKIYLAESEFSQRLSTVNEDRLSKIMISAIEQSNNLYLPELILLKEYKEATSAYDSIVFFTSQGPSTGKLNEKLQTSSQTLMIIGPEGGFSTDEDQFFQNLESSISLNLPLPILRASTAVPVAFGLVLSEHMRLASKL